MPYLVLALKLLVVPAGLALLALELARDARLGSITIHVGLLLAALAVNQVSLGLFAARMQLAMRVFDVPLTLLQALRVHLQSMFYFFVLPMTVGLEIARFAKIRSLLGERVAAGALTYALLADRLVGAVAALALALALLPFMRFESLARWSADGASWLVWSAAGATVAGLALMSRRVREHAAKLFALLRSEHRRLASSFGIALVTHASFALAIYLAAIGTGIPIGLPQALFAVSAAMLFVVVPVSFAGVSPVEAANFGVLIAMGFTVEQAGVFTFIVYAAKLVAAIEGAAWEIAEGGRHLSRLVKTREAMSVDSAPTLAPTPVPEDLTSKTISDFGDQWTTYTENPGYYGSVHLLQDLFGPLMSLDSIRGRKAADIGSGTGRIVNMLLEAGAGHVVAVEPSAAYSVLKKNTARHGDRVTLLNVRGDALPADLALDVVVSMGVLHHIPDPAPVVAAAHRALKPGGRMLVWLYGIEGNEPYLRFAEPLRAITKRLPHPLLALLCSAINVALDVYIFLCRFLPLPMRDYMRQVLARFPRSVRRLTIYDQLNPAYAKYYTRAEAEALLAQAGFREVATWHRHGYSWSVAGRKA